MRFGGSFMLQYAVELPRAAHARGGLSAALLSCTPCGTGEPGFALL